MIVSSQLPAAFSGWLSKEQAAELCRNLGLSPDELLINLLLIAADFAITPISNFQVGAVCRGLSGAIYCGANLEFPGGDFSSTIHAEQSAAANAFSHKENSIDILAVTAAPCGHCRQFLLELSSASDLKILLPDKPPKSLLELLPEAFGPGGFLVDDRLMTPRDISLELEEERYNSLTEAAFNAARLSYAPYSLNYAGVAVETFRGNTYAGSAIECAAFNPGLPPLQTALINLVFAGEKPWEIIRAVLVETKEAPISYSDASQSLLRRVSNADLSVILAEAP